jgi:molybdopterin synthase catalytic subunit
MPHTLVTDQPIDPADVLARVGHPEDGSVLLFLGVVRNHHDGKQVTGIRYEAYQAMAESELAGIAAEAAQILGTDRIAVVHRTGDLDVGEASVAVAVSSPHRAQSYEASRFVMEEIKKRVPVWKLEGFTDGSRQWVEGTVPPTPAPVAAPAIDGVDGVAALESADSNGQESG